MSSNLKHPVIQLIEKRKEDRSLPNRRKKNDHFKLGLVIEGGGMRGVVGTAMASALHFLGLVDVFDAVYGASAGSLTGTFFVTNRAPFGPAVYYENLNNDNFIDLKRGLWSEKPTLDLDYLIWDVLVNIKPMDWVGVMNSPIPLHIIVSSLNQGKAVDFVSNEIPNKEDLFTLLKASACIPLVAGPPVEYKGDLLSDASVYESIPYKVAVKDGCTHILCLLTRPKGLHRSAPGFFQKYILAPRMRKIKAGLDIEYLKGYRDYNYDLDYLFRMNQDFSQNKTSILSIAPAEGDKAVSRLEKSQKKLIEGSISGLKAVYGAFNKADELDFGIIIHPFHRENHKIKLG
jgi:predicted patatin/cPLA2 family phospholipase